jgi:Flp pilus assembly protein TadD
MYPMVSPLRQSLDRVPDRTKSGRPMRSPVGILFGNARIAAQKALELDPQLSEAYSPLALVSLYNDWDWPAAERGFRRAIQFKPENAEAHNRYALALAWFERFDEALGEIRRAAELDPLSPRFMVSASQILYQAGNSCG